MNISLILFILNFILKNCQTQNILLGYGRVSHVYFHLLTLKDRRTREHTKSVNTYSKIEYND